MSFCVSWDGQVYRVFGLGKGPWQLQGKRKPQRKGAMSSCAGDACVASRSLDRQLSIQQQEHMRTIDVLMYVASMRRVLYYYVCTGAISLDRSSRHLLPGYRLPALFFD